MNFSEAGSCSSVSPVDVDTAISELSANEVATKESQYSSTRYGHHHPAFLTIFTDNVKVSKGLPL